MTETTASNLSATVTYQGASPAASHDLASRLRNLADLDPRISVSPVIRKDDEGRPYCEVTFETGSSDVEEYFEEFRQLLCKVNDDLWLVWQIVSPQDADNATNVVGAI